MKAMPVDHQPRSDQVDDEGVARAAMPSRPGARGPSTSRSNVRSSHEALTG